ncbi:hypothetical protein [Pseudoalteromonas phenolica]|uniref:hypothetical protein n=1 Tax=Pseudoalteromonas phenolica TaxID=161398 RepID=UPI001486C12B|nr:hypothetical protein [Pseudoalteromonas phenolica]
MKLNKKKIKNLSTNDKVMPTEMTPQIAGGGASQLMTCEQRYAGYKTCGPCNKH